MNESIVIEVKDNVASSISTKLKQIANDARDGDKAIKGLQKSVNGLDGGSVKGFTTAIMQANTAITKAAIANQNLATAQQKTAIATASAAAAQQKAVAAATSAATAQAKLSSAQDAATLTAMRLQQAQERLQARELQAAKSAAEAAVAQARLAASSDKTAASLGKAGISTKQYNAAMRGVPAQITDIVVSLQAGQRPLTVLLQQGGQLKDMFGGIGPAAKALAAGFVAMVNPITITIAAFAAFIAITAKVESNMRDLNWLIAQFSATGRNDIDGSFIGQLKKELSELPGVSRSAATEIIKSFAEVRNVGSENLKAATAQVSNLATALGIEVPKAADKLAKALDDPLKGAIELDKELGFLTVEQFKSIKAFTDQGKTAQAQKVIIDALKASYQDLARNSMTPLQKSTDELGNAWNRLITKVADSSFFKSVLSGFSSILDKITNILDTLSNWTPPAWLKAVTIGANPVAALLNGISELGGGTKGTREVSGKVIDNSKTSGPQFQQSTDEKLYQAGIKKRPGAAAEESRASALAKINAQLSNELKLMNMLGPEREKSEMFDRIEEGLIGRKIQLTDAETASIKARIAAIVDNAKKSQAMARIYDEIKGPQEEWNATIEAADELLKRGTISQEAYNRTMIKNEEIVTSIKQPLRDYLRDLNDQLTLSKLTSEQVEIESGMLRIKYDLLSQGIDITKESEKAIAAEVEQIRAKKIALQEANLAQQAENSLLANTVNARKDFARQLEAINKLSNDKTSGFTSGDKAGAANDILSSMGIDTGGLSVGLQAHENAIQQMYDNIALMRQKDLINEEDAANARLQIWLKGQEHQMAQAQGFFSGLEGLAQSSNKNLARIGKAAAISNAIIDTYKSATGAYAAMSSIPYVGPALGAAAAAAAIAAGMANVQAIRSQGYQAGGYTGNMPTTAEAGVVHGQEFVMNANATAAHGVGGLQALQDGSASIVANSQLGGAAAGTGGASGGGEGGGAGSATNLKIVNVLDPAMVGDFLQTPEGGQVFVNAIRYNASAIKQTIQNA